MINGASGGVGTFAVQIAKAFGADVTAVCSNRNLDMERSIGADHVIDYTQEDFTKSGRLYDLILAANGYHPLQAYKRALAPKGIYVTTGGSLAQVMQAMVLGSWMSETSGKKVRGVTAAPSQKDLLFMKELMEDGKVVPVIDRCYPLSETAEALRYLGAGHASAAETLCGRVITALRSQALLNESVGAGYIDRNWPPALKESRRLSPPAKEPTKPPVNPPTPNSTPVIIAF